MTLSLLHQLICPDMKEFVFIHTIHQKDALELTMLSIWFGQQAAPTPRGTCGPGVVVVKMCSLNITGLVLW
jgi:hypothetical protein